jgi:hypothetical protein
MDIDRTGDDGHLFHLVLYADLQHGETYLMEMLTGLLLMPHDTALRRLGDLATKGRSVLMTCARANADLARDQVEAYAWANRPSGGIKIAVERVYAGPN